MRIGGEVVDSNRQELHVEKTKPMLPWGSPEEKIRDTRERRLERYLEALLVNNRPEDRRQMSRRKRRVFRVLVLTNFDRKNQVL